MEEGPDRQPGPREYRRWSGCWLGGKVKLSARLPRNAGDFIFPGFGRHGPWRRSLARG
jgi:hypothetical protein